MAGFDQSLNPGPRQPRALFRYHNVQTTPGVVAVHPERICHKNDFTTEAQSSQSKEAGTNGVTDNKITKGAKRAPLFRNLRGLCGLVVNDLVVNDFSVLSVSLR